MPTGQFTPETALMQILRSMSDSISGGQNRSAVPDEAFLPGGAQASADVALLPGTDRGEAADLAPVPKRSIPENPAGLAPEGAEGQTEPLGLAPSGSKGAPDKLVLVAGATLIPQAGVAWGNLVAAAAAAGIKLGVGSSYRNYDVQMQAYQNFKRTGENLNGSKVPNIAHPDSSYHTKGRAVDISYNGSSLVRGSRAHDWMMSNAKSFGFSPIANEPWHFEWRG